MSINKLRTSRGKYETLPNSSRRSRKDAQLFHASYSTHDGHYDTRQLSQLLVLRRHLSLWGRGNISPYHAQRQPITLGVA